MRRSRHIVAVVSFGLGLASPCILRAQQQLLLETSVGKVVIELNSAAPKHVEQLQHLVDGGILSGCSVVDSSISGHVVFDPLQARFPRMPPDKVYLIHSLSPESPRTPQLGDVVSYTPETPGYHLSGAGLAFFVFAGDANGAGSAAPPPGTIVGHVIRGIAAIDELTRVPRLPNGEYDPDLGILAARFVTIPEASSVSTDVRSVAARAEQDRHDASERWTRSTAFLATTLGLLSVALLIVVLFDSRIKSNVRNTILLTLLLIGYFVLFSQLVPLAPNSQVLSIALFVGLLSVIKLMNKFDTTPRQESAPPARPIQATGNKA